MSNPLIEKCQQLFDEGLPVSAVWLRQESGEWYALFSVHKYVPHGEGGELPRHKVTLDRKDMPEGVTAKGWQRWPDQRLSLGVLPDDRPEQLIAELATAGESQDWAAFGDGLERRYLTKPNKWFKMEV